MYLVAGLLVAVPATLNAQSKSANTNPNKMETMIVSTEKNKAIIRRLYNEGFNKHNPDLFKDLISLEYKGITGTPGPQGFSEPARALIAAFPDIQWNVQELLAEDDKVFVWWKVEGRHSGIFQGIAPTGKTVSSDALGYIYFEKTALLPKPVYLPTGSAFCSSLVYCRPIFRRLPAGRPIRTMFSLSIRSPFRKHPGKSSQNVSRINRSFIKNTSWLY